MLWNTSDYDFMSHYNDFGFVLSLKDKYILSMFKNCIHGIENVCISKQKHPPPQDLVFNREIMGSHRYSIFDADIHVKKLNTFMLHDLLF